MTMRRAWLAIFMMACTSAPSASAAPGAAPSSPSPASASSAGSGDLVDVTPAEQKTATGGDVVAVGVPRFQLVAAEGFGSLFLRAKRGAIFAQDGHWISIWDAATGSALRHIAPRVDAASEPSPSLAVSSDGEWLATGSSYKVRVFRHPFDQPVGEIADYDARAFSHDGKLLACSTTTLGIFDVAKRELIARYPPSAPKDRAGSVAFAPDNRSLLWTTDHAVMRWEFAGTGAVTPIYQATARISQSTIAANGSVALVILGNNAVVVDLATRKTTSVPARFGTAISPTGQRLAFGVPGMLQVIDVASGKAVWTAKISAAVTRIAFGETDDSVVYLESKRLRVAILPGLPSTVAQPSRFAGWLSSGVAAIEHDGVLRAFTLATRASAAADRTAAAQKLLDGGPAWARWVAEGPSDKSIAAEPSKRHELVPDLRGGEPCDPKLRVWTKDGGTKTLTMPCSKPEKDDHEDPGWELGGGWVIGVSTSTVVIYDPRTGRQVAALPVPPRKNKHADFAPAYWLTALAPTGDWLALVWRRPELIGSEVPGTPDARGDAMHIEDAATSADCVTGAHGCQLEYFAELWTLKGAPKRVWQARLERSLPGRELKEPAQPSGVLMFDRTGDHLFVGFDDGEVRVISTAARDTPRIEHLHRGPIRALSIDPSGTWAFSADAAGEQRLWKLAP